MSTFRITVDLAGLRAQLQADAQAMGEAARPAAQAGAQVLVDEVRRNVGRIKRKTGKKLAAEDFKAVRTVGDVVEAVFRLVNAPAV